jgi:hypothetical protein
MTKSFLLGGPPSSGTDDAIPKLCRRCKAKIDGSMDYCKCGRSIKARRAHIETLDIVERNARNGARSRIMEFREFSGMNEDE